MNSVVIGNKEIRPVTYGLALYFLLIATDCFPLGTVGSLLKIVAFIPLALSLFDVRRMQIRFDGLVCCQFLFWFLGVLSLFYSVAVSKTETTMITQTLNFAFIFVLGSMHTYSETEAKFLHRAMLLGSWLTIILMMFFFDISANGRLSLKLGEYVADQNFVSGYLLLAFSYHCKKTFFDRKWQHLVAVLLVVVIVLLTGSRGAFLAFVIVLLFHLVTMVFGTRKPLRNFFLFLVVVIAGIILFKIILKYLPAEVTIRFSKDYIFEKGTTGRVQIWQDFWTHFSEDNIFRMLFGHGFGTSDVVSNMSKHAHNLYLEYLITSGIIGLLLQIISQGFVIYELFRQKESVLLGAYVGLLVLSLSLSLIQYKPIWNIMIFALVLRYRTQNKQNDSSDKENNVL